MESSSLKNGRDGRERDTKRKMELFPQALALLQALQIALLELQNVQDEFPSAKTEEKGSLDTSAKTGAWRKGLTARRKPPNRGQVFPLPPGASHQTGGKSSRYRPVMTKCRQAVTNSSACLTLGWPVAGGLFCLALASRCQALPVDIFLLSLLFRVTH